MNIIGKTLGKARQLEATLARTVDRAAQQWSRSGPRGPLEVLHAILEAIEGRLEPAGRGTHVFPFNHLKVSIVAASRDARVRFAGVLDEDPPLRERIANRLRELGCDASSLRVRIVYVSQPESGWTAPEWHIEFGRTSTADVPRQESRLSRELTLTITHGSADQPAYALTLDRINLGRCSEVRDSRHILLRTNHVVFTDGAGPVNDTISRRHAHIDYHENTRCYRLADDRSAHGTSILRDGKTITVPPGSRGVRLESGDEVILGEARLRVRIADTD